MHGHDIVIFYLQYPLQCQRPSPVGYGTRDHNSSLRRYSDVPLQFGSRYKNRLTNYLMELAVLAHVIVKTSKHNHYLISINSAELS